MVVPWLPCENATSRWVAHALSFMRVAHPCRPPCILGCPAGRRPAMSLLVRIVLAVVGLVAVITGVRPCPMPL